MKHYDLLRQCAAMMQFAEDQGDSTRAYLVLTWPKSAQLGIGRFPYLGGGTELLSVNSFGDRNYRVPVKRIITAIGKAL